MPFYQRLSAKLGRTAVVAIGSEPEPTLRAYLERHGLTGVPIISTKPGDVRFYATPTIAIVTRDRRVLGVWVGKLRDSAMEDEVVAMSSRLAVNKTRSRAEPHGEAGLSRFPILAFR